MIKDIKYNGFSAQPSDYECPDGELAAAINLIPEDGAIHPILPPTEIIRLDPDMEPAIIHKTSAFTHFIILNRKIKTAYWLDSRSISSDKTPEPESVRPLGSFPDTVEIYDFNCIGNVAIVATSDGMCYFMWDADNDTYKNLGNHIPEIDIEMALMLDSVTDTAFGSKFSFTMDDTDARFTNALNRLRFGSGGPRGTYRPQDAATRSALEYVSNSVIGALNKYIAEKTADNLFLQPFFVRYAYRLFDGSSTMASAPILMIPNATEPVIRIDKLANTDNMLQCTSTIFYTPAALTYRILSDTSTLSDWKNIITHIDIFVSPQIYTFDQSADLTVLHRYSELEYRFSHIGTFTLSDVRGDESDGHHRWYNNPSSPHNCFYIPQKNIEQQTKPSGSDFWRITPRSVKEIEADITSSMLFHRVASIDFDDIITMNNFARIEFDGSALSSLTSRPQLADDFHTHHTYIPRTLYPYNSRLSIANISLGAFPGFPIRSMCQFSYSGENARFQNITIYVKIKSSDRSRWIRHAPDGQTLSLAGSPFAYDSIENNFPRWLFYPDSTATEMIVAIDNAYWRLPLSTHEFLNGAYWFRGLKAESPQMTPGDVPDEIKLDAGDRIPFLNRICASEVLNPFSFPLAGIVAIGSGEIHSICAAAKALSQGQFGQFPLYAFSSEGVWALEVSSTGTYSARQPITRDVILENTKPLQMDSAVLFATDRGIMLISGSQTQCITDVINAEEPFNVLQLPGMDKLHSMLGHDADTCLPTAPFLDFISECDMIYDYVHQRVIVYNPNYTYAYVFSLKSKSWGMTFSNIASHLNSYPEALAVDSNNNIVNFSETETSQVPGLMITRPLKLDTPDVLKTMDTVIQRGLFRKGHVKSVLYGSRDLYNWHLLWSSNDHFLRGFRGTPYKYFRIALLCNLSPHESIFGASLQFNPRQTNQPR